MGRPQAHARSWLTTSDQPICKRQCCSLPHTPESPAIARVQRVLLDVKRAQDEFRQLGAVAGSLLDSAGEAEQSPAAAGFEQWRPRWGASEAVSQARVEAGVLLGRITVTAGWDPSGSRLTAPQHGTLASGQSRMVRP